MKALAVALVLLLAVGFSVPSSSSQSTCVCGTKKVLLVLAEFPEYQHLSDRAEIAHLFFGQVARYFLDVSYGKLAIGGNATDWIMLPKLYEQYRVQGGPVDILAIAKDSFSVASQTFNFTLFDEAFLVLSFYPGLTADYIQLNKAISTPTGSVGSFAVVEEDREWSAYARGFGLMIGLWKYRSRLTGLGQLDIASSGLGDMSAFSKLSLGWINRSQIVAIPVPSVRHIIVLNPIESTQADTYVLRIDLGPSQDEYLIEVRQPVGYDRNNLQGYGVVVLYAPPGNSSLQFRTVLQPSNVGTAIFLDPSADLSVVALNQTQTGFRLLVSDVQDGRDAQRTLYAMDRASDAMQKAGIDNRTEGLDMAETLAENAHTLFTQARFQEAEALAVSAETTANSATIPSDYYQSVQSILQAESLKNATFNLASPQGSALAAQGSIRLDIAKQAFAARNFTFAKQSAQAAIELFNRAEQTDFTERILEWLSTLALAIPVLILAYALRYQLKST